VDRCWQAFLRRFDLEHTFRLLKRALGWTVPKIRTADAADRWTWLVIAAHSRLRLARPLAANLRRPWERPARPGRLTPARVRRGFRNIRARTALLASAPAHHRAGQRCSAGRAQGRHRGRLVRGPPVWHGGRLQGLRRELRGPDHLARIQEEAQDVVAAALG
jgi:hypothetical protein